MSTRSQWSFRENGNQVALIYKHSDGYPNGHHGGFAVWDRFIAKIKQDCQWGLYGWRFDDPEYLAARFVYYLIRWENQMETLETGGVGVSRNLHDDIEYLYEIDCDSSANAPALKCKSINLNRYVNKDNLVIPLKQAKGSITVKGKHFNSIQDAVKFKQNTSNDSYLKLRRKPDGKFIKMDTIARFQYPHKTSYGNLDYIWRKVKVVEKTPTYIEGIENNDNGRSGYKKFLTSKIIGKVLLDKGYLD